MFTATTGLLTLNGVDLATLGAELVREEGLFDGLRATVPTEALATGGAGHVLAAPSPLAGPREVTLTLAVGASTNADLRTVLRTLRGLCAQTPLTLGFPAFDVARHVVGYATRLSIVVADPQTQAKTAAVTLTLTCPDPAQVDATQTTLVVATTPVACPVGTLFHVATAAFTGPCTSPGIQIVDGNAVVRAALAFTGLVLGTGDTLTVDGLTHAATKVLGGVSSSALANRTAGRPLRVDPAWGSCTVNLTSVAANATLTYRRRWA